MPASSPNYARLKRGPYIWSLYLLLGLFAFMLTMVGPMVPYLQDEFGISYALAGLHQSAFALGMVLTGLFAGTVIRRLGLTACLYGGMAAMLAGLLVMVAARTPAVTLGGCFLMSIGGTVALAAIQTGFANGPEGHRTTLIMEGNVLASVMTMLVPVTLVAGARLGMGWRVVFPTMLAMFAITAAFGLPATRKHQATRDEKADAGSGSLGAGYWRMWLLVFFGVSVEWAIGFWCMSYLAGLPGGSREMAAAGTVVLGLSAVLGRFVSSRLSGSIRAVHLVAFAMALAALGFPLYWLRADSASAFAGLFLCGFGSSNFYPLGFSLALGHARTNAAAASSYMPIASGLAIGLAPFLLGRLADGADLKLALLYIPIGLLVMGIVLLFDGVQTKKAPPAGSASMQSVTA